MRTSWTDFPAGTSRALAAALVLSLTTFPSGWQAAASAETADAATRTPDAGDVASSPAPSDTPIQTPHGSFVAECGLCHGAKAWSPTQISPRFDHGRSGFELSGAHSAAACAACHLTLDFKQNQTACAACHEDVHRSEMGADCARCHTSRSFIDRTGMARAHQLTRFPLTGSHAVLDCESCHPGVAQGHLQFVNIRAECESCHLGDYRAALEPDHASSNFPLQCEACHSTLAWNGARFDHARSRFPLTGAHRTLSCQSCHGGGVYSGTSTDCAACHRGDYDRTTEPAHAAAGFPLACASCHSTSTWDGARFDHDGIFFPIYSGRHNGRWQSCADCHSNPASYAQFTCISCHEHSQTETDSHHREVSGYRYESQACYTCHPRGDQ